MIPQQISAGLLLLFLAAGTVTTHAATRIWTGAQNGLWSNPANWQGGFVPTHLDSLEFPADASVREMVNDLSGREYGSLTFKGGQYNLSGNQLPLLGGLTSIPGNTTNWVACDIFVGAPMTFAAHGYFNELAFSGSINVAYPLRLVTGSVIKFYGHVFNSNEGNITMTSSGRVSFGPNGRMSTALTVAAGTLELTEEFPGQASRNRFSGLLIVGDDGQSGHPARVLWRAANKLGDPTPIILTSSGTLDLDSHSDTIGLLNGSGQVVLNGGVLTIGGPGSEADFAGEFRGNGTVRVEGLDGGFTLSGHHSLTGAVQFATRRVTDYIPFVGWVISEFPTHANFSGSLSNAAVTVTDLATLSGHGVARSLTATNAVVRPGPGTLRFLEGFTLDAGTLLDAVLDGPDAGSVQAGTVHLNEAALRVTYHGLGESNEFALVTANATTGSTFQNYSQGAWLLAGDPAAPSEFQLTYAGGTGQDVMLERAGLFAPPMLSIQPLSATERRIEWPISAQGYTLQHTPNLHLPAWTANGLPAPATTATEHYVIDDTSPAQRFYRLTR